MIWPLRFFIILCFDIFLYTHVTGVKVVIQIPGDRVREQDGLYRLSYSPPQGIPPPNSTFTPRDVAAGVELTRALPGTKYDFHLYYSNASISEWPMWTASITTVPSLPTNLSISVRSGKVAQVLWGPPHTGGYSRFKLKVIPLSERTASIRNVMITVAELPFLLRDLTAGASYELQLYTVYEGKESAEYISSNFTTRPNAPGRFIVWFRNQTDMLVLWQPPYPAGIYSHYKVSIEPPDVAESVILVEKGGDPPGPAQAAFNGLVPGRQYNITVATVSQDQVSMPTSAPYRTIPIRPQNVSYDHEMLRSDSFTVTWKAPEGLSEFSRYHISLGVEQQDAKVVSASAPLRATFHDLQPGETYTVLAKTVAGNVASWPSPKNITTRPLKVRSFTVTEDAAGGAVDLHWQPNPDSKQDKYKVEYLEVGAFNADSRITVTSATDVRTILYSGRNYSVSVEAVSNGVKSLPVYRYVLTKPASLIMEPPRPIEGGLNVSWKSDVRSKQDHYAVLYTRNDTGEHVKRVTSEAHVLLEDLYPGAGYEIKVFAISRAGLWSEPHIYFQAIYPNPVRNLSIVEARNTSLTLSWEEPLNSVFNGYVCRYRTMVIPKSKIYHTTEWKVLKAITQNGVTIEDLIPGERYEIEVRASSFHVESFTPERVTYTAPPNSVGEVERLLSSKNVTLRWARPEGRIDKYTVVWWADETPNEKASKEVSGAQATAGIDRQVSVLVGSLSPGRLYQFDIATTAHRIESVVVTVHARTVPLITSSLNIVNSASDTRSFAVRYTPTPPSVAAFDRYRFVISDALIPAKEKSAQDKDKMVMFDDLIPGREYNVTAWTVSGDVESLPLTRSVRTFPDPILRVNATRVGWNYLELQFSPPEGDYDGFKVSYIIEEDNLVSNRTSIPSITITGLRPHRNYTFTVATISGTHQSVPFSKIFATNESMPGKIDDFKAVLTRPTSVDLSWDLPPEEKNGIILNFLVTYHINGIKIEKQFPDTARNGTITGLAPDSAYSFRIQARTKVGLGRTSVVKVNTSIGVPPIPSPDAVPQVVDSTARTVTVAFERDVFSPANGHIVNFTVVVEEVSDESTIKPPADDFDLESAPNFEDYDYNHHDYKNVWPTPQISSDDAYGKQLAVQRNTIAKTWKKVQESYVWPAYEVWIPPSHLSNSTEDRQTLFTLGSDLTCDSRPDTDWCNGPLKPGTAYSVKIRAYTAPGKYTDTVFSRVIVTESERSHVGIAVSIPLVLVALAIAAFVAFHRRRPADGFGRRKRHARADPSDDMHSLSDSIIGTSRPVKLCDFIEHYRYMHADSDFRFSEEYEALNNVGRSQPCLAAEQPCNRPKNRFTNILPYDHSRVKLQPTDDEEGSDYCNSNFVPGFNSPREFVVTQGPLVSTRDDFWRMVWETQSKAIVMLTRCIEKSREKCDHYWPYDTNPVFYGDISVTILNESHYSNWIISEFRLCKDECCRLVRHFYFTTWPDFGVPEPSQTLVRFVRAFRERVPPDQQPIVVHCSAGVGRSGTFIALDRILQGIHVSDYVDVFGIVYEMRKERVWMVQNEMQYICIHQCLVAVLEGRVGDRSPTMPLRAGTLTGSAKETHDNHGFDDDEGIEESGM